MLVGPNEVLDSIPGIPGCPVILTSNRLYIDYVLLMVADIGRPSLLSLVARNPANPALWR
jgi:hypothetical protein